MFAEGVGGIVTTTVVIVVMILVLVFGNVLAGKTYQNVESDIQAISNGTIESRIVNGVEAGFSGLKQVGDLSPTVVLAVVIGLILSIVLGIGVLTTGRASGGSL